MADEAEEEPAPTATSAEVEAVRLDIAQRLAALTPKTGQLATDVVAILKAIQGSPGFVKLTSPGVTRSGSYNSEQTGGWSIEISSLPPRSVLPREDPKP